MSMSNPIVLLDARARYVHPAFQMTRASTKTVFDATGKLVTVPVNALGWDHDPATGQARGYLAEPSATNLLLHSNDLSESAWGKNNSTITPGAITGPDGNGVAKLVEDSNLANHTLTQTVTITDGADIVVSQTVKAAERPLATLLLRNASLNPQNVRINFNSDNGTIESSGESDASVLGSGVFDLGGGFYRVWLAANFGTGVTSIIVENRLRDDNGNNLYQGDGTSGLYLGYMQAEEGSYPTSYIETGAATATRAGDSLVLPGLGDFPWWRSERGTMLVDVDVPIRQSNGEFLSVDGSSLSVRWAAASQNLIIPAGIADGGITLLTDDAVGRHRIAVSWDDATLAGVVDGSVKNTRNVISSLPSSPALGLGCNSAAFNQTHGCIHRAVYYPQRLSNADLQSLTAIQE